jgi:tRNA-specific 2-thiouridylase
MSSKRVLIGLSGGVDSSVSAYLLKEQGYQVEGVYLHLHDREGYFEENIERVKDVSDFLKIPLHTLDRRDEFYREVYKPFADSYIAGETPNPCAVCNREIKFGEMFRFAEELGVDYLATGHYLKTDGNFIYEAEDSRKDQSYFLFDIDRTALKKLLFPLSNIEKSRVKEIAGSIPQLKKLSTQKESSEICFVEDSYTDILKEFTNIDREGDLYSSSGEVVGKHRGYMHYTIGKRRGFTLRVAHEPHYVKEIVPEKNGVVVAVRDELYVHEAVLKDLNMFIDEVEFTASVKLRYRAEATPCRVQIRDDKAYIELEEPVFGLAKGQAGVFYRDGKLLGGGWII